MKKVKHLPLHRGAILLTLSLLRFQKRDDYDWRADVTDFELDEMEAAVVGKAKKKKKIKRRKKVKEDGLEAIKDCDVEPLTPRRLGDAAMIPSSDDSSPPTSSSSGTAGTTLPSSPDCADESS